MTDRDEIDTVIECLERSKKATEDGEMTRARKNAEAAALLLEIEEEMAQMMLPELKPKQDP